MKTNVINEQDIQDFIKQASFEVVMSSGGLDSYNNYSGHDWAGWLCGPSESRDADIMTQSNFQAALEILGGKKENVVEVRRCGHWACGWFNQIMVNSKNKNAVKKLLEIKLLLEEYPILDESDFYERESEAMDDCFKNYESEFIQNAIKDLSKATDVPHAILTTLENSDAFKILVHEVYRHDCTYRGYDDGFVSAGTFLKHFKDIDSDNWASSDVQNLNNQIKTILGLT